MRFFLRPVFILFFLLLCFNCSEKEKKNISLDQGSWQSQASANGHKDQERKHKFLREIFQNNKTDYVILIIKKNFRLEVYNKDLILLKSYLIGYGSNPDQKAKRHEGDHRTPEGIYKINRILSLKSPVESESYQKLVAMNKIYFRAKDGHSKYNQPNLDLGDNAYGPRFYGLNYPNKEDQKKYQQNIKGGLLKKVKGRLPRIGSGIALHGTSDLNSLGHLSSQGCIRMSNQEIVELDDYVSLGLPVAIVFAIK